MPPKTVTCKICGQEVTKRKSLAWDDGRACRIHAEVRQMVQDKALAEEEQRLNQELNEAMAFYAGVSFIRVYHTMLNIPVSLLLNRVPKSIRKKVMAEVDKQGAKMTQDEIFQSMFLYSDYKARAQKVADVTV